MPITTKSDGSVVIFYTNAGNKCGISTFTIPVVPAEELRREGFLPAMTEWHDDSDPLVAIAEVNGYYEKPRYLEYYRRKDPCEAKGCEPAYSIDQDWMFEHNPDHDVEVLIHQPKDAGEGFPRGWYSLSARNIRLAPTRTFGDNVVYLPPCKLWKYHGVKKPTDVA